MRTFSRTVRCGNTAEIWKDRTSPSRAIAAGLEPVISRPLYKIWPRVGERKCVSRLKQVVLPAPLGPISAWMRPRLTLRLTSLTATKPLNSFLRPRVSRMMSSAMDAARIQSGRSERERADASGECRHYNQAARAARRDERRSCRGAGGSGQQAEIAARRRGVHRKNAFGRESHEVIRAARFRSGPGQPLAAERLHAHDRADHVAVDIEIADRRARAYALGARVQAGVHAHRKPVSRGVDVVDYPVEVFERESRYVEDGAEALPGNLAYRPDFERHRSDIATCSRDRAGLGDQLRARAQIGNVFRQFLARLRVDHRSDVGRRIGGIADAQRGHRTPKHVEHRRRDLLLQV